MENQFLYLVNVRCYHLKENAMSFKKSGALIVMAAAGPHVACGVIAL
jgi:hypothetical protein